MNRNRKIKLIKAAATVVLCVVIAIVSVRVMSADPRVWVQSACVLTYMLAPALLLVLWRPFKGVQEKRDRMFFTIGTFIVGETGAFFCLLFCFTIGAIVPTQWRPESVFFRTEEDLERITGIDFPEVTIVDSMHYEVFPDHYDQVIFEVAEENRAKLRDVLPKQSDEFWTIEDDWISYFIYPDISWDELATFDRRRGDPFYPYRGVGYYYIGVTIRPQMDTINVWYGLSRR